MKYRSLQIYWIITEMSALIFSALEFRIELWYFELKESFSLATLNDTNTYSAGVDSAESHICCVVHVIYLTPHHRQKQLISLTKYSSGHIFELVKPSDKINFMAFGAILFFEIQFYDAFATNYHEKIVI